MLLLGFLFFPSSSFLAGSTISSAIIICALSFLAFLNTPCQLSFCLSAPYIGLQRLQVITMSRLTMSPFHKPSPFEFPRAPLSPPETYSDTIVPPPQMPIPSTHTLAGQDFGMPEAGPSTSFLDTPSRVKRPSSIPYHHNSNSRESKDRVVQRNTRTLILVIPPSTLIQDNGRLSSGPYHRLSQGVVMPLFPSVSS